MSKKNRKSDLNAFVPDNVIDDAAQAAEKDVGAMYESEAYGTSEPDKSMEVTVTKPVGIGGPVPIIAPKQNTVQLQPIVVPLAVVPYMTQDTSALRTDGRPRAQLYGDDDYVEAVDFEKADAVKRKKRKVSARAFSAVILILSALAVVPFVLAYFFPVLNGGKIVLVDLDVAHAVIDWVNFGAVPNAVVWVLTMIGAGFTALTFIVSLISLIVGRMPKFLLCALTLLSAAPLIAVIIYEAVTKALIPEFQAMYIATAGVCVLNFVLTLIFALSMLYASGKPRAASNEVI